MGLALAGTGDQAGPGVLGLDAVAKPVGTPRRARLVSQRVGQPIDVGALGVGIALVAVGDLLSEVLRQVPDATGRVLGPGQHALSVEPFPEPRHMQRLVVIPNGVQGLIPGGRDFARGAVEVGARALVPDRQRAVLEPDGGRVRPPHLVIGGRQHPAQLGPGDGAAHGEVDVRGQPPLGLDCGEVLHVVAEEPAEVLNSYLH